MIEFARFKLYFRPALIALYFCIVSFPSFTQDFYFEQLSVHNGLSQNDVNSIIQDSYGFMWIGTYDGLNRFDGIKVESFQKVTSNPESLPDNRISALYEDPKKRLWIGTEAGLFCYYSLQKEKFIRVKSPESTGVIHDFLQTNDNTLYAITSTGILRFVDGTLPSFEFIGDSKNLHFKSGIQGLNRDLYFAGNSGIFTLKNDKLTEIPNPTKMTFTCLETAGNILLASGPQGIFAVDKIKGIQKLQKLNIIESTSVLSMTTDLDENIWIGTDNRGLFKMDQSLNLIKQITSSRTEPRGLLSNSVLKIYCDRSNNLWVGNRHGLCYTRLNNPGFGTVNLQDLHRPNVRSLYIDGKNLLIGIINEGLFRYDLQTARLEKIPPYNINYVNHITKINNTIYVCSDRGLFDQSGNNNFKKIDFDLKSDFNGYPGVRCLVKDDFSRIFIATNSGIIYKQNNDFKWVWEEESSLHELNKYLIFRMYYDPGKRQLLIGTVAKGLFILEMDKKGKFLPLKKDILIDFQLKEVNNTSIWCFHETKDKTLWIGTDIGLFKRDPGSNDFRQINTEGVIDKKIMSISEDKNGLLWLSNTLGLIQFSPETGKIKKYTHQDGLLSSSLTEGIERYGDTLFFGTSNGVNFINPNKIAANPYQPHILLSHLKVHNESVSPGKKLFGSVILSENINTTQKLTLNHLQNNFSLEFSGTNFLNSRDNNFRYRLDGFDNKWIYAASNRIISYSNLDPGTYTLNIQIEDNEGNWSENELTLPVTIIAAPWKTPFAYILYVLLTLIIIGGFIYFWFNKERLNHQIQLDQIKINQDKELRERQLRSFVDVAHEFKTPISLILAPFNDLMNQTLSQKQKAMCLQIISRNIGRMNFLVHQLLDFGKISEGENLVKVSQKDLRQSIREYIEAFQWQVQHENIDLRMNLDPCVGYFDRNVLEKGFYNVLSNAFKYTPQGGIIDISLKTEESKDQEFAIITVSDSGPGVPDDQKELIFERFYHGKDRASSGIGLHLAQRLILAHGGSISVEDSQFNGTQFKIVLPISKSHYKDEEIDQTIEEQEILPTFIQEDLFDEESTIQEETILIVEDDLDLRNYLCMSLQNDYTVLTSGNGENGLEFARLYLPDIIISDVMMPVMDGIEMCRKLKSNKDTSHIPILFLTAKNDFEYQKKGLEAGAWDYITKPFDSEVLRIKVMNILQARNKFKTYLLNHNINSEIKTHYTPYDQKLLKQIHQVIEDNRQNPNFTVTELAREVGLSRMHLHRKLKTLVGETGKDLISRVKIKFAVSMFDQGCDRVQEAMDAVGMNNYGSFNNNFKKFMNVTATEYIAQLKEKNNES